MLKLRPYQETLKSNVIQSILSNHRNILVIAATGAGKTVTFIAISEEILKIIHQDKDSVVLILSHLSLLTDQTGDKFGRFSDLKTGVLQADVVPSHDSNVIISTMQSARDFDKIVHLVNTMGKKVVAIIVDESQRRFSQSYSDIFSYFPNVPVIDFTATPFKNKRLATGFYDDVAFQVSLQELIDQKYLVPPVLRQIEFNQDSTEKRCAIVLGTYLEFEKGKKAICFMRSKNECKLLADAFTNIGVVARVVTADTPKKQREVIFASYDNGDIDVLISVSVLEAGFDSLKCECVFMFGTESPVVYMQRLGRSLRPEDGDSVKPHHQKQSARVYVFGDTPTIQSGTIEKHHDIAMRPKKKHECKDLAEIKEWLEDNDLKDTPEYYNIKEAHRVQKIANKLNMPLIASLLEDREIGDEFLGKIGNVLSKAKPSTKPATIKQKKELILALQNNRDVYIEDYSAITEGEMKALYKMATGGDYTEYAPNNPFIVKTGIHAGKHIKDIPWAYKSHILKKAPNSDIAKIIRSFHKKTSQPK